MKMFYKSLFTVICIFYTILFQAHPCQAQDEHLRHLEQFVGEYTASQNQARSTPGLGLTALYPVKKLIPNGREIPWIFFIYESKELDFTPGKPISFYPSAVRFKNWTCIWFYVDENDRTTHISRDITSPLNVKKLKLRCYLRYTGHFQEHRKVLWNKELNLSSPFDFCLLSEEQLEACRPELLLLPTTGLNASPELTRPSFFSRFTGWKAPERIASDPAKPTNFLMLMVDTLRADHTPMGGHPFVIAPHTDMLASLGAFFSESYGASSSTRPSVGSLFTGLHPIAHNAKRHALRGNSLLHNVPLLAESFKEAGFNTVGISSNAQITDKFGFARGFDVYECPVNENAVTPRGLHWLRSLDEPFFMYLHYMAPHAPYEPPATLASIYKGKHPRMDDKERELQDLYCAEITLDDRRIGEVLKELSLQGILEKTLIWLVSDHGEEFWEHGWNGHGAHLYEEAVRTVSVATYPRLFPMKTRVEKQVTHVDIFPTLTDLFGFGGDRRFQGKSLLPLLRNEPVNAFNDRPIFLHHGGGLEPGEHESDKQAVLLGEHKLVWWNVKDEWELYDLTQNPGEDRKKMLNSPETRDRLEPLLKNNLHESEKIADSLIQPDLDHLDLQLSPADIENLRRGGYVN